MAITANLRLDAASDPSYDTPAVRKSQKQFAALHSQSNCVKSWTTTWIVPFVFAAVIVFSSASTAQGEVVYQRIKSFGFPEQLGVTPQSGLVIGNDGAFYGTTYSGGLIGGGAGVVYRVMQDGSGYQVLHAFPGGSNAANPLAGLLVAGNVLYGTASGSSSQGLTRSNASAGVIFQVNTDGTGYVEVHTFGGTNDGLSPRARLIAGSDGNLYGTTYAGGTFRLGTVFKLSPDGSSYSVLHHFSGGTDGSNPSVGLVCGSNGTLYGTTQYGGNTNRSGYGTVFRLNEDGSSYTVLYAFSNTNGSQPRGDLIFGPNNTLLGTTFFGGTHSSGTVFSMNEDGTGFTTIYNLGASVADGSGSTSALLLGADGFLYGTTSSGGTNKAGTIFKLYPDGSAYSVLAQLADPSTQNQYAIPNLIFGTNGDLYGTKPGGGAEGYGLIFKIGPDGSGFATVRSFYQHGGDARGAGTTLIRASDSLLYGTAPGGGIYNAGAIYRFSEDGSNYALIHSFVTSEGASPTRLLEPLPGVLFGATASGGVSNMGTVFRVDTDGSNFTLLHSFTGGAADGQRPLGGLVLAQDGALYGTTTYGGTGFGTIYRLMPDGSAFQVVYAFLTSPNNGVVPVGPLVQGSDDALYGTTDAGGQSGRGSVFKVNTDGSGFTVLHQFTNDASDGGGFSQSGLLVGPDNALYGVTAAASSGSGCVFRVTQDGSQYTVLHLFTNSDGWNPQGELTVGADGALYGATQFGGTFSGQGGVVFKLNTDGTGFSVLHSFAFPVGAEGARPTCGLVLGASNKLLGVTPLGGDFQDGVLYCVAPATVTNNPPALISALPNQALYLFNPFNYTVPAGTFFDRDWGDTLTYSVSSLPPGLSFDPATVTFIGTPARPGVWNITVTATDNGLPSPLSASNTFQFSALAPDLAITVQTNVLVSWPAAAYRFYLEQSSQLGPGAVWTSLGEPSGYQIGSRRYAPLPLQPGQWFFRLSGPY